VRTEYAEGHARHGEILFYKGGEHVRTEYAEGHARQRYYVRLARPVPKRPVRDFRAELDHNDESVRRLLASIEQTLESSQQLAQLSEAVAQLRECQTAMAGKISTAVADTIQEYIAKAGELVETRRNKEAKARKSTAKANAKEAERAKVVAVWEEAKANLSRLGDIARQNWKMGDVEKALRVAAGVLKTTEGTVALESLDPEVCETRDEVHRLRRELQAEREAWQMAKEKAKAVRKAKAKAAAKANAQPPVAFGAPLEEGDNDLPCAEAYAGTELEAILGARLSLGERTLSVTDIMRSMG
jgi:flagellar biosynthesis chaperone FliJ